MTQEIKSIISDGIHIVDCINIEALNRNTTRKSLAQISQIAWERVQELHIFGPVETEINHKELDTGCYLNESDSWALVVGATTSHAENIIYRCGKNLKFLDMRFLPCSKPDLHFLVNLESLHLSSIGAFQEIEGLERLQRLTELELSFSSVGPRLDVSALSALKKMDLTGNPGLTHLDGLSQLINLQELDLSGTAVGPELNLSALRNLKRIQLVDTRHLERIFSLGQNANLEHLDLACSALKRIPDDVRELTNLVHLDLSSLDLEELPDWLPELGLDFTYHEDGINLRNTKAAGEFLELFDRQHIAEDNFSDYQQKVKRWFATQKSSAPRPVNELRVIFLGDGDVGKSYTIARLMHEGAFPENDQSPITKGVAISDKELRIGDRKILVHFWDFDGQAILHSLHRMFMSPNAVYVVVLSAREETQDERAQYWLSNISSFAADAPVLIALNKVDQNPNASINERELRLQYPNLKQIVRISAIGDSPETFRQGFLTELAAQLEEYIKEQTDLWQVPWIKLKDLLQKEQTRYIDPVHFRRLMTSVSMNPEDGQHMLQKFSDLGICTFHPDTGLSDYIILRPDWLINALCVILANGQQYGQNGILTHDQISLLLNGTARDSKTAQVSPSAPHYTPPEIGFILGVMRKFHISYEYSVGVEFVPSLCQQNSPEIINQFTEHTDFKEFHIEYDFLPIEALHYLMVSNKDELDIENAWLQGARFVQKGSGQSVIVMKAGNRLQFLFEICNSTTDCDLYLDQLLLHIEQINTNIGLKVSSRWISYVYNNFREMFDYDMLSATLDAGIPAVYSRIRKQMVNISDIIAQTDRSAEHSQKTLITDILIILSQMRSNQRFWKQGEAQRNAYLRDALRATGYYVIDQALQGVSVNRKYVDTLDMDIRRYAATPWTVCESLQISNGLKTAWNEHLSKLLCYDALGLSFKILIAYIDCNLDKFQSIWMNYRDHIRKYSMKEFPILSEGYELITTDRIKDHRFVKAVKCQYQHAAQTLTVYHIFVQMGR